MSKETMRAFVAAERGRFEVRDVPVPEIGDDDILIKAKTAAICGSDVHIYDGSMDPFCGYPMVMGHENAGVIAKVGKNVDKRWQVGDRVTTENTLSVCGTCYACTTGEYVACEKRIGMGIAGDGCMAEYFRVPGDILRKVPDCIFRIPDNISFEEVPLLEPAANGYKAVFQEGELKAGEDIIVSGVGAIGLYSIHMAAIGGAAHVIAMVRRSTDAGKIEAAKKMGATDVVYSDDPETALADIARLTKGYGAGLAIETTGASGVMDIFLRAVHELGRIVRIAIKDAPYEYSLNLLTLRSVKLIGHMGYNTVSWRNVLRLAEAGKLDLKTPVTAVLPLEECARGFDMMASHQACKVVITID